jgi:transposase
LSILTEISNFIGKTVSKDILKKFLKSMRYSYRRIRKVLKKSPDPEIHDAKLKEILQLVGLEKKKFLKIYFADECGFNETPCVPYGWQSKDEPLSIPTTRGQRWNVFGIMSSDNQLFSNKTKGSIKSDFIIKSIDEFALSPHRDPQSVIMIDNAKIHHSEVFKAKIEDWQQQGVRIFYLPTYSPHLNRIETLWRKCKYEWLLPQDYVSWQSLTEKIEYIFSEFGSEFTIDFEPF